MTFHFMRLWWRWGRWWWWCCCWCWGPEWGTECSLGIRTRPESFVSISLRPSYLGFGFSYPLFLKRGLFVNKKSTYVFKIWGLILIPYSFTLSEDRCSWWPRQWLSLYFEKQRRKNYLPIICRAHHDCPIFWKQRRNNLLVVICRARHGCPYIWKTKKKWSFVSNL